MTGIKHGKGTWCYKCRVSICPTLGNIIDSEENWLGPGTPGEMFVLLQPQWHVGGSTGLKTQGSQNFKAIGRGDGTKHLATIRIFVEGATTRDVEVLVVPLPNLPIRRVGNNSPPWSWYTEPMWSPSRDLLGGKTPTSSNQSDDLTTSVWVKNLYKRGQRCKKVVKHVIKKKKKEIKKLSWPPKRVDFSAHCHVDFCRLVGCTAEFKVYCKGQPGETEPWHSRTSCASDRGDAVFALDRQVAMDQKTYSID